MVKAEQQEQQGAAQEQEAVAPKPRSLAPGRLEVPSGLRDDPHPAPSSKTLPKALQPKRPVKPVMAPLLVSPHSPPASPSRVSPVRAPALAASPDGPFTARQATASAGSASESCACEQRCRAHSRAPAR